MDMVTFSDIDNSDPPVTEAKANKRRRKKSIVWEHFTVEKVEPDCIKAFCKQCKKPFAYITGSKLAGTSHLKRHISLGICPASRQTTDPPKKRRRSSPGSSPPLTTTFFKVDQTLACSSIAKMVILHEYPLNIVEQPGFVSFVRNLQPEFEIPSFDTVQGDCVAMYLKEKQSLLDLVNGIPGKVCLALDLWVSDYNSSLGYVFVTGHFVDGEWNLHRRILNVVAVPIPSLESPDSFSRAVTACLSDWCLEERLFTLTMDQSFLDETSFDNLRSFLPVKNQILLNGQLLIGNCLARVLGRLAREALGLLSETIGKIRENVKYVKTSESHEVKFLELKSQLRCPSSKELTIDDRTRWDTTYHMLVSASEHREVLDCLEFDLSPSSDEWNQIGALVVYLQYFFEAASVLTAPTCPTANIFFPELSKIQMDLIQSANSLDPFITYLTRPLHEAFDKYWSSSCLGLAVAVVMDPRFKMTFVEFTFNRIYGENAETWIRIVDDGVHELFVEYMTQMLALPSPMVDTCHNKNHDPDEVDALSDFDIYISDITDNDMKSELDQYLLEPLSERVPEMDVLSWWSQRRSKYPTLSRMASDVLSIPVSTVAPGSVFDTDVKKMSNDRASLSPVTVEALFCAKDWLLYGSSTTTPLPSFEIGDAIVRMDF